MMSHRKDFENQILALKFTANPFIRCAMLVQGLKGSYIIQSGWSPQKIQEIAFKKTGFHWIPCLPEMSSTVQLFLGLITGISRQGRSISYDIRLIYMILN